MQECYSNPVAEFDKKHHSYCGRDCDNECTCEKEYSNKYSCGCDNDCTCDQEDEYSNDYFDFSDSNNDATVLQEGDQYSFMDQESAELIWVKESCNITVNSTDTQAGISLQAGLQLAISLVLNISIGDTNRSEAVSQELLQNFNASQTNKQKIFICNTKDANVTTTDTDLTVNIQVLLQLLLALVVLVDIL
ncbi:spore coat protein [Virgibacillus ainsalahensis]